MPPILLNILTILMAVSFTSAAWTDLFDPLFRTLDYGPPDYDEEFDYVKRGKCSLSGCTRPPNRVCRNPIITLFPTRTVNDLNSRNVAKWKKGVKYCARLCRDEGELDDGTFACESFNYRYNKTSSGNCILYKRFPNNVIGTRRSSTRVDFTNYYCYTREERSCSGMNFPP